MRTLHGNRNQICLRALLAAIAIVAIGLAWAKNVSGTIDEIKRRRMAAETDRAAARQDYTDSMTVVKRP